MADGERRLGWIRKLEDELRMAHSELTGRAATIEDLTRRLQVEADVLGEQRSLVAKKSVGHQSVCPSGSSKSLYQSVFLAARGSASARYLVVPGGPRGSSGGRRRPDPALR